MEKESHHHHRHHHRHHRSRSRQSNDSPNKIQHKPSLLSKHKELMEKYIKMKEQLKLPKAGKVVTDQDAIARNTDFIMDTDISKAKNWEQRLAIRYYNRLFKEYALVDLTFYKLNKIGMRWRTEKEVIDGKGQFACGNIHCDNANIHELCSYEVPFSYKDLTGKKVTTLVKVRVCGACAIKLHYKKIKEYEQKHPEGREKRLNYQTSQELFDYLSDIIKNDQIDFMSSPPQPQLQTTNTIQQPSSLAKQTTILLTQTDSSSYTISNQPSLSKPKSKPKPKPKPKPKRKDGHCHYSSSSSELESEQESLDNSQASENEHLPEEEKKVYDANGNEVISTSNDIWKTNIEVEHTENEKMDDFINQLFM